MKRKVKLMKPLARSADPKKGIPSQLYVEHINNVSNTAVQNAVKAGEYYYKHKNFFIETLRQASIFHDLGKLDSQNQEALRCDKKKKKLPINHVDAGTAYLLQKEESEAALLVYSHHKGLCSLQSESKKTQEQFMRDTKFYEYTNSNLQNYLKEHETIILSENSQAKDTKLSGLTRRIALSCLVDGDHGDAAVSQGKEVSLSTTETHWQERLQSLDNYVEELFQKDPLSKRNIQRNNIYKACRNSKNTQPILACDSPVGTGKTTAVMANLLKIAIQKKLRHIIVVLPYTNIIKQSVEKYREALVLPGENPQEIVAEHHHQADFSQPELRQLTTLWKAPIIVTTAVQFFETLASNIPSKLRKLHELPGSAVFIDETHAVIPIKLWPPTWIWLKKLTREWNCHFVLASGSLPKFWELDQFKQLLGKHNDPHEHIPDLIPDHLSQLSHKYETKRVSFLERTEAMDRQSLIDFILSKEGPRLVIMNTVQSAAVIANEIKKEKESVMHLSTALTPADRNTIVEKIKSRLKDKKDTEWTLVATSCVEAGMNFSFRTVFRERVAATSLIQIGGRANREGKDESAEIWDFRVVDKLLNQLPGTDSSRAILGEMFKQGLFQSITATQLVTEAMRREFMRNSKDLKDPILKHERLCEYPEVSQKYRVIEADTRLVVIDQNIINSLKNHQKVSFPDLIQNSVQIWSNKIKELEIEPIRGYNEIYKWTESLYEPDFLGYMKGVLPVVYAQQEACII
jgi:CRISPR-associated endonuclease/helicase Cas3